MSFILRYHPQCNPFCKACSHKHLTLQISRNNKLNYIKQIFYQHSHCISDIVAHNNDPYGLEYRNKILLHAKYTSNTWIFGLKHNDTVIPIHYCPLHHPSVNYIISVLQHHLPPDDVFPLVYLLINHKQLVFVLKTNNKDFQYILRENVICDLQKAGIEGIHLHLHPSAGLKVFGKAPLITIEGSKMSKDEMGFWYGPLSFMQPIAQLAHKAYELALDHLMYNQEKLILFDLYCGRGIMTSLFLSRSGMFAYGVEADVKTIEIARLNAQEQAVFLAGTVEQRIPQLKNVAVQWHHDQIVVFTNPSRKGMGKTVSDWLAHELQPSRIAYLSCNPLSLRDDLLSLIPSYRIIQIVPFDFFPWTHHVECFILLERK